MKAQSWISCWLYFCFAIAFADQTATLYVSPTGSTDGDGSLSSPLDSLTTAKNAVQKLKSQHEGDIQVLFQGGRYEVHETVIFSTQDSGSKTQQITYAAAPGETPVFSAGKAITNWKRPKKPIPGLPKSAQPHILTAQVTHSFKALYDEQGMLPRASTSAFFSDESSSRTQVIIPETHFKPWSNPSNLEIVVRPHHAWIRNILPVHQLNVKKRALSSSISATYAMWPLHFLKETPNCWIENAIEELDQEGEWVLDSTTGTLYLWPRNTSMVYAPQLQEILRLEGEIDVQAPTDQPISHLHFEGFSFEHGDRYSLAKGDAGMQHDWNFVDKDNALVRLRGTEHCSISDSHFRHSGSGAIRVDLHGIHNLIENNHIEHLGGSGILLAGYGPGTKNVNHHNTVTNNHIHHVGEIFWHAPGIMVWQSGDNLISNNLIHHTNYTGLIISGCMVDFFFKGTRELSKTIRWHEVPSKPTERTELAIRPYLHTVNNLITNNEIHHAMEKMGDGNAIYIRGAGARNIIQRNYIHHLVTPMIMQCAIRTDGGQRDTIIRENIIYKCTSQGMMLKLNTQFENNIIADIISPPRGYYLSLREGPLTGATIKHNIFYSSDSVEAFIHEFSANNREKSEDRRGRAIARATDAETDYNLYFAAAQPNETKAFLKRQRRLGIDKNSLRSDPMFVDPANGDFTLHPDSPAIKLGFKPIDMSTIGLRPESEH